MLIGVQIYCFCKVIDKYFNICLDLLDILTCFNFMKITPKLHNQNLDIWLIFQRGVQDVIPGV